MLHDRVIDQWGAEIVSRLRPPGQRIGADEAATRLGVSRTVVREAVRVLESLGLITVRQRVGITVTTPDRWNALDDRVVRWRLNGPDGEHQLADIQQMRIANEPLAAQLAARRSSASDRQALTDAVVAMADAARAGDHPRVATQDAHFHRTLLQAAGNPMLAGLAPLITTAITADQPALAGRAGDADAAHDTVRSLMARQDPRARPSKRSAPDRPPDPTNPSRSTRRKR